MKDSTTRNDILTPCGAGHMATELYINWRGLTEEGLYALAARAVIAAVQQDFKANNSAPAKEVVEAHWFVDRSVPSPIRKMTKRIADLPEHLLGAPDQEERGKKATVDSIYAHLTDAEKAAIIQLLGGSDNGNG